MSAHYYASQYKSNGLGSKVLEATPHRLVAMMLEGPPAASGWR
jgi:flagellin-specific chaperone FliS